MLLHDPIVRWLWNVRTAQLMQSPIVDGPVHDPSRSKHVKLEKMLFEAWVIGQEVGTERKTGCFIAHVSHWPWRFTGDLDSTPLILIISTAAATPPHSLPSSGWEVGACVCVSLQMVHVPCRLLHAGGIHDAIPYCLEQMTRKIDTLTCLAQGSSSATLLSPSTEHSREEVSTSTSCQTDFERKPQAPEHKRAYTHTSTCWTTKSQIDVKCAPEQRRLDALS